MKRIFLGVLSLATIAGLVGVSGAYANHSEPVDADPALDQCTLETSSITSDSSTEVNATSSVAVDNDTETEGNQVPSAWTADIDGATWIWSDAQNDGDAAPGTEVFTREFNFSSDATSTATLLIATDNTYEVRLNGVLVGSSTDEVNFTLETQDEIDLSDELVEGSNTLEITVTNLGEEDNPAGLLYRLDLEGFVCEEGEVMPTGEILNPEEGETVSGEIELLAVYDDGDHENDDAVQWAVRSGTCEAGTGTVFGNVDGHSDSFDWDGETFSAMINTETVSDGNYCFIFNPTDDEGQEDVRLANMFVVDNADEDEEEDDDGEVEEKAAVCHIPPGNPSKAKTIHVDSDDVESHLVHGDHEGECDESLEADLEVQKKAKNNR